MKNLLKVFVFVGVIAMLTSCASDYTCTCVDADGNTVGTPTTILDSSKGDAETECSNSDSEGVTCTATKN